MKTDIKPLADSLFDFVIDNSNGLCEEDRETLKMAASSLTSLEDQIEELKLKALLWDTFVNGLKNDARIYDLVDDDLIDLDNLSEVVEECVKDVMNRPME